MWEMGSIPTGNILAQSGASLIAIQCLQTWVYQIWKYTTKMTQLMKLWKSLIMSTCSLKYTLYVCLLRYPSPACLLYVTVPCALLCLMSPSFQGHGPFYLYICTDSQQQWSCSQNQIRTLPDCLCQDGVCKVYLGDNGSCCIKWYVRVLPTSSHNLPSKTISIRGASSDLSPKRGAMTNCHIL